MQIRILLYLITGFFLLPIFGNGSESLSQVVDSPRDSLPGYPTFTGQEDKPPPAPKEQNHEASYAILLYVQSARKPLLSNLRLSFLQDPIDAFSKAPLLLESQAAFQEGTLYDGAYASIWSRTALDTKRPGYLSVVVDERPILENYLALPGDSVKLFLDLQSGQKVFVGPDYARYELQDRIAALLLRNKKEAGIGIHFREGEEVFSDPAIKEAFVRSQNSFGEKLQLVQIDISAMLHQMAVRLDEDDFLRELESLILFYRNQLDKSVLSYLQAKAIAGYYLPYLGQLHTLARYASDSESEGAMIEEFLAQLNLGQDLPVEFGPDLPPAEHVLELYYSILSLKAKLRKEPMLSVLTEETHGLTKDYLLAKAIYQHISKGTAPVERLQEAFQDIESTKVRDQISPYIARISRGAPVEDFQFYDTNGKALTLADFKGKTVLVNTYFTGCSASISFYNRVLSQIEAKQSEYKDLILVSISSDKDEELWKQGLESGLYNSPNWIRLHTGGQGYSHPFFRNFLFSTAPRPFLIDAEGRLIAAMEIYQYPENLFKLLSESLNSKSQKNEK
jgi:hypothetical protein